MIEFGSDFHYVETGNRTQNVIKNFFPFAQFYADGRMALIALYHCKKWKRLWVPEYFCYEVLLTLKEAGLNLAFYLDYPNCYDDTLINDIPFESGDALLRMNYFGMRDFRNSKDIPIPVVEDHTHDLIGDWALSSKADWCIASLRKTLPIAEGGILWSPKNLNMPDQPDISIENQTVAMRRWHAMRLKSDYLAGSQIEKQVFRSVFIDTEQYFDTTGISSIDNVTATYINQFDVKDWYDRKRANWLELKNIQSDRFKTLVPESLGCHPFSYVILCESKTIRDDLRQALIENHIYPAVLWNMPENVTMVVKDISTRILSIHCDGRYSIDDIQKMKSIIESLL